MKTLYIDCRMGVSGAKLLGALIDIMEKPDVFIYNFNKLGMDGVVIERLPDALNGIAGSHIQFTRRDYDESFPYADEIDDEEGIRRHRHYRGRKLCDIIDIINSVPIKDSVAKRAIRVYENIINVYSQVNVIGKNDVVLHRAGTRDNIAAVLGVCIALDELAPEQIIVSTVAVGDGYVQTPRGRMPIPTPEIQTLLKGIPYTAGIENGDLCSLCGAALVAEIADGFGDIPEMAVEKSGAGFGARVFKNGVNCVRTYIGKSLYTSADKSYVRLTAEIFGMSKVDFKKLSDGLADIGVISASVADITALMGDEGHSITVLASLEASDTVATYLLENTTAKNVIREVVNAYSE